MAREIQIRTPESRANCLGENYDDLSHEPGFSISFFGGTIQWGLLAN